MGTLARNGLTYPSFLDCHSPNQGRQKVSDFAGQSPLKSFISFTKFESHRAVGHTLNLTSEVWEMPQNFCNFRPLQHPRWLRRVIVLLLL